jgi:hypothetical protein
VQLSHCASIARIVEAMIWTQLVGSASRLRWSQQDFAKQGSMSEDQTIRLTVTGDTLKSHMDLGESGQAIIYDIQVLNEENNLPITMDKVVYSHRQSAGPNGIKRAKIWSQVRGCSNAKEPMASHAKKSAYNRILPGATGAPSHPIEGLIYKANHDVLNSADFSRWINRDWEAIDHDLVCSNLGSTYYIPLPETGKEEQPSIVSLLQWMDLAYI